MKQKKHVKKPDNLTFLTNYGMEQIQCFKTLEDDFVIIF